ncbi:MAG: SAM-dependent methyltransferase [Myxococcota bacterium]
MPITMTSRYSAETEGARVCLERAADLIADATRRLPAGPEAEIVDYGCADGGTTSGLWRQMIESITARNDVDRVHLVGNDLPFNDFATLAGYLSETRAGRDEVRVSMVPVSFYDRVAAPATVSLAFSATAMHWLSTLPHHIERHTHANATTDEASFQAFSDQADRDFEAIMLRRADELRPGGQMVLVNLARTDDGLYLGHNGRDRNMHEELHTLWAELRDEGRISAEQYRQATFQNFYKAEAQFRTPFVTPDAAVHRAGLRLRHSRIELVPCPYRRRFDADGNADKFARGLMRTVRSWSEHTFNTAMGPEGDLDPVRELYARFETRIATDPQHYSMDYVQSYLHVAKEEVARGA